MKFLTPCSHLKSLNENGEISGYASVFNSLDGYGDVVVSGAFKNAVADFILGKKPKLLWQHDINAPIGVLEEICEDDYGLFVKGRLLLEIPKAKEVYFLLKSRAIDGFSIGYKIKNNHFKNNKQYLTDIDLLEVSVVTFPACEKAIVGEIKSDDGASQKIRAISKKIKGKIHEQRN
ncbi:MAG: HK97 family phage prohead protease [Holosporaceae bacterium]|jgi:HK97 family phage prohead protease|nr:HK97 family phage prohead protease [Holosporaceae bacterium]